MRAVLPIVAAGLLALGACALIREGTAREASVTGMLLLAAGLPLMGVARRQLGTSFSVGPQAKGLVTHGLYARIPHPMYVFLDLALLGAIVALRRPWLLVGWGGLVVLQTWQAGREARVLEEAFGDAYRGYRARTWW